MSGDDSWFGRARTYISRKLDYSDSDSDGLSDAHERQIGTNPYESDSDGDGAGDGDEVAAGTDPTAFTDTDGDGLSDAEERALGTDPTKRDTDGDRLTDGDEVQYFGSDPTKIDTDGDGLKDHFEVLAGTDPSKVDTDGDGISDDKEDMDQDVIENIQEQNITKTHPNLRDSNHDGQQDLAPFEREEPAEASPDPDPSAGGTGAGEPAPEGEITRTDRIANITGVVPGGFIATNADGEVLNTSKGSQFGDSKIPGSSSEKNPDGVTWNELGKGVTGRIEQEAPQEDFSPEKVGESSPPTVEPEDVRNGEYGDPASSEQETGGYEEGEGEGELPTDIDRIAKEDLDDMTADLGSVPGFSGGPGASDTSSDPMSPSMTNRMEEAAAARAALQGSGGAGPAGSGDGGNDTPPGSSGSGSYTNSAPVVGAEVAPRLGGRMDVGGSSGADSAGTAGGSGAAGGSEGAAAPRGSVSIVEDEVTITDDNPGSDGAAPSGTVTIVEDEVTIVDADADAAADAAAAEAAGEADDDEDMTTSVDPMGGRAKPTADDLERAAEHQEFIRGGRVPIDYGDGSGTEDLQGDRTMPEIIGVGQPGVDGVGGPNGEVDPADLDFEGRVDEEIYPTHDSDPDQQTSGPWDDPLDDMPSGPINVPGSSDAGADDEADVPVSELLRTSPVRAPIDARLEIDPAIAFGSGGEGDGMPGTRDGTQQQYDEKYGEGAETESETTDADSSVLAEPVMYATLSPEQEWEAEQQRLADEQAAQEAAERADALSGGGDDSTNVRWSAGEDDDEPPSRTQDSSFDLDLG